MISACKIGTPFNGIKGKAFYRILQFFVYFRYKIRRVVTDLLVKLNYKGQNRIAVINAEEDFFNRISEVLTGVIIDRNIDPRFPYSYIILFVKRKSDIDHLTPVALHNLTADGTLWFCYPKKTSKKYRVDIDRDHGWDALNNSGFRGIRMVSVDDNWSALRFRNVKYIKSAKKTSGPR
jgi:hypothetical protein